MDSDAAPGATFRLSRVEGTREHRRRLMELGFVPGRLLRVLARGATGGLLIGVDDARLALDQETCHSLQVICTDPRDPRDPR